jgi:membrane-bound acyltransferase YfiQ involved in biofilm formation
MLQQFKGPRWAIVASVCFGLAYIGYFVWGLAVDKTILASWLFYSATACFFVFVETLGIKYDALEKFGS